MAAGVDGDDEVDALLPETMQGASSTEVSEAELVHTSCSRGNDGGRGISECTATTASKEERARE